LDLEKLKTLMTKTTELRERLGRKGKKLGLVLGVSFVAASGVSDFIMAEMMSSTMISYQKLARRTTNSTASVQMISANYRDIRKAIEDRNIFNLDGEFPDESDPSEAEVVTSTNRDDFDMNAACVKSNLPLELVGTIYLTRPEDSIATIKEKGFSASDLYKVGDLIIDHDDAQVAAIHPRRVVVNNAGVKECLELIIKTPGNRADGFPDLPPSTPTGLTPLDSAGNDSPVDSKGNSVILEEAYVQKQLGAGFGNIIQKARLVPNTNANNGMNGFKIFAIDKASLIGRIGLKNGDIITGVNEVSLKQPEQGFQLYQALQDEREITIKVERKGKPKTINIQIK
jgi:type II secretion system protein C